VVDLRGAYLFGKEGKQQRGEREARARGTEVQWRHWRTGERSGCAEDKRGEQWRWRVGIGTLYARKVGAHVLPGGVG
jgi:hypothetical protein